MNDEQEPNHDFARSSSNDGLGYVQGLEINKLYSETFQNNCAVIERTGDGISVGACTHYLKNGTTCPRHGVVKVPNVI